MLLPGMAGRSLWAMHRTADYKHGKALKSCRTEFFHIHKCGYSFSLTCDKIHRELLVEKAISAQ
jgi:hypothetical protein